MTDRRSCCFSWSAPGVNPTSGCWECQRLIPIIPLTQQHSTFSCFHACNPSVCNTSQNDLIIFWGISGTEVIFPAGWTGCLQTVLYFWLSVRMQINVTRLAHRYFMSVRRFIKRLAFHANVRKCFSISDQKAICAWENGGGWWWRRVRVWLSVRR